MLANIFQYKRINVDKLLTYGFTKSEYGFSYKTNILNGQFTLTINVNAQNDIKTELFETETGEIYTLHLIENAQGTFIGKIREEYNSIIEDIAQKCFDLKVFKTEEAYAIIDYVNKKYGTEPEYLWEKFPNNAVFRRKDNKKWYGAILTAKWSNFGFCSDEPVEVLDLRIESDNLEKLLNDGLYPAYHMNKKHWASIIFNGKTPINEIFKLIDKSYILATKKSLS